MIQTKLICRMLTALKKMAVKWQQRIRKRFKEMTSGHSGEGRACRGNRESNGPETGENMVRDCKLSFYCLCLAPCLVIRSQRFDSLPKWVKRKGAGTLAPNSHKQPSLTVKRTEYYCHYWLLSPFPSRIYSPIPTRKKCIYHQAKTPFSQNIMFNYFYFSFCKKATIKKQIKSKNSLSPKKLSGRTKESFFI